MAVDQILVHVASTRDDPHSRTLATAYNGFSVKRSHTLHSLSRRESPSQHALSVAPPQWSHQSFAEPTGVLLQSSQDKDTQMGQGLSTRRASVPSAADAVAALHSQIYTSSLIETYVESDLEHSVSKVNCSKVKSPRRLLATRKTSSPVSRDGGAYMNTSIRSLGPKRVVAPETSSRPSSEPTRSNTPPSSLANRPAEESTQAASKATYGLPPRASVALLESTVSHITPDLARIADQLPIENVYLPLMCATRELAGLERGCWVVYTTAWPLSLIERFWAHLIEFVGDGRAGWGVSCWRDEPGLSTASKVNLADSADPTNETNVKVYCFGEVVGHLFLLLYVASESMVKGPDARWLDADGQEVIRLLLV